LGFFKGGFVSISDSDDGLDLRVGC
jgi:hypothetical protein